MSKRFMVYWVDVDENYNTAYIEAEYARDAVDRLEIPDENVIEVAVCLENWKNSKKRGTI